MDASSSEFVELAGRVARLVAEQHAGARDAPVQPGTEPGEVLTLLPGAAPEEGESWEAILRDVGRVIGPHLTRWQHPGFFAYFPANLSYPAVLAELLTAGLGNQGMLWATGPAATELEMRMMDWLGRAIGLPERFMHEPREGADRGGGGVIQGTASEALLSCMIAARDRALENVSEEDRHRTRLGVYTSEQAHSSAAKAAQLLGPTIVLRTVATDETLAMRADALREAIEHDRAAGIVPAMAVLTLGTTATTAVDPIEPLSAVAQERGLWTHVDAAFMGAQLLCAEHRHWLAGVERVESFNFNPHKWMLTNFDCSALWLSPAGRRRLNASMSITPEYLRNKASEEGGVVDFRDWHIPLGRRMRALKLWFVMRHYGLEGLRTHVRKHIEWASELEAWVHEDERFEVVAPVVSSLVCLRLKAGDEATQALLEEVNASGEVFVTHAVVPVGGEPRYIIRVAIGGTFTQRVDVERVWGLLRGMA